MKKLLLILCLSLSIGCADFAFDIDSFGSTSNINFATVLGITGGSDSTLDVYLFDGTTPVITWSDLSNEESY